MSLEGRIALVTGRCRAICTALAEDGADVAVNYRRDEAAAKETVVLIEGLGRRAVAVRASVDRRDENDAMVETVTQQLGAPDILINNAGIASRGLSVVDTDPDELARVLATHALGPHRLCQRVLPGMREKERGDIVMISSVATLSYGANGAPYNMGKAAMEALAFTLAKEVRHLNIHVNVVAPGLVETEMGRRLMRATAGVEDLRQLDRSSPFGRVCQPEDVANVVRFLVSERAGYLTGEKINVHGGGQL